MSSNNGLWFDRLPPKCCGRCKYWNSGGNPYRDPRAKHSCLAPMGMGKNKKLLAELASSFVIIRNMMHADGGQNCPIFTLAPPNVKLVSERAKTAAHASKRKSPPQV